jgi:hypothetical protein
MIKNDHEKWGSYFMNSRLVYKGIYAEPIRIAWAPASAFLRGFAQKNVHKYIRDNLMHFEQ